MGRVRLGVETAVLAVTAVALIAMAGVASGASDGGRDAAARPQVLRVSLTGVVDPFMASYVQRGIHAAAAGHDSAVAITIDTPGGLDSSMREIVGAILSSPVPVICYVRPGGRAAAAGTFGLLACPVTAMARGPALGP